MTIDELQILITAQTQGLTQQINNVNKQLNSMQGTASKTQNKVTSSFKGIGKAVVAAFSVAAITNFTKSCLDLGSDLAEVQNVVDVTFTTMSDKVNGFAKTAMTEFGLSETVTKKYMGTFGAMSQSFGLSEAQAYSMAEAITGLTGDVASFYNLSTDEAYTKMKSIWTGETESLKDLGVVMTQTALDQYALANGYGKTTAKMTEAEKVMLRYNFVQEKLASASGDFARTSDGWANQVRVLKLQFDSLKATLGQGFINVFTPIVKGINAVVGRLQVLAEYFKQFTTTLMGNKQDSSVGATTKEINQLATGANEATDSIGGIGDTAEKTAKKAKVAFAGFDEINTLSFGNDSEGSESTNTGVADLGLNTIANSDTANDNVSKLAENLKAELDKIKAEFMRLKALFEEGFKIGLGDMDLSGIMSSFANIRSALMGIFEGLPISAFADKLVFNFGKVVGSIASIGATIVKNIIGGFDKYLNQNKDYIRDRLVGIFEVSGELTDLIGNFSVAFADIFSVFGSDEAQQITANIIGIFSNAFLGVTELGLKLGKDILSCILQPIIDNKDVIKTALLNTLTPIQTFTGTLKDFVTDTFKKIFEVYEQYLEPTFSNIKDGLNEVIESALNAWNKHIAPMLRVLADEFDRVFKQHIQPMIDTVIEVFGKLSLCISELWENILAPVFAFIVEKVAPIVSECIKIMGVSVMSTISGIADKIKGLFDTLGSILDFLTRVFQVDWKSVWDNVKKSASEAFENIKNACKSSLNGIIDFINKMVDGINSKLKFEMPEVLGGGKVEFAIPKIPKLAKGGIINQPTLAMVGEAGREAVVPLESNTAWINELASKINGKNNGSDMVINIQLGDELITKKIIRNINRTSMLSGKSVLI